MRRTFTLPTGMSTSTSAKQAPKEKVLFLHWMLSSAVMCSQWSRE